MKLERGEYGYLGWTEKGSKSARSFGRTTRRKLLQKRSTMFETLNSSSRACTRSKFGTTGEKSLRISS